MKKLLLIFLLLVSLASAKAQDRADVIYKDTIEEHALPELLGNRWSFSIQGGLAYSLTNYDGFKSQMFNSGITGPEVNDYVTKLKNGYHVNTSLTCLVTNFFGLGFDYNFFSSKSRGEFVNQGYSEIGIPVFYIIDLDERIYLQFIGATAFFQQFPGKEKRIKITESLSPGIVFFRDEVRSYQYEDYYEHANNVSKGSSFGAKGGLSIEYSITPHLSVGLAGNFTWGRLKELSLKSSNQDINDIELQYPLNISHVDYGVSIRYNL